MAAAVGMQVLAVVSTAAPAGNSNASRATCNAAVPDVTAMQWRAPSQAANSSSNPLVSGPRINWLLCKTR